MIEQALKKAKIRLLVNHPFYASICFDLRTVLTDQVSTVATDGESIYYNPDFFLSLSLEEQITLIAHEGEHVLKLHPVRRNGRDMKLWNEATDYSINGNLVNAGFVLPKGGLHDPRFDGMAAERIYDILFQESPPTNGKGGNQPGDGNEQGKWQPGDGFPGGLGDVMDLPGNQENAKKFEQEIKEKAVAAYHAAKAMGKVPGHIERLIDDILNPKLPWKELLRQFVVQCKDDYSWRQPNRRYINQGIYLPAIYSENIGNFVLIVDTSGSISHDEVQEMAAEVTDIASMSRSNTTVMYVDSDLQHVESFEPGEEIVLHPKGGGGTDFVPGFEHIAQQSLEPACTIYFTDGYCNSFPPAPDYPVIWVIKDNESFEPPFGEVIHY